jgi:hypothetical protein
MTAFEAFALIASGLIIWGVSQLRNDDDDARATDPYDVATGGIVLALTWLAAVALAWLV